MDNRFEICPGCGGERRAEAACPRCPPWAATAAPEVAPASRLPAGPASLGAALHVAAFGRAAVGLGLLGSSELARFGDGGGGGPTRLAESLVDAGRLTAYQASALLQGKGRSLELGGYLILSRCGAGGMGMVFKAEHRATGQVVAIKILPPGFGNDPHAVRRFRREIAVAERLDHPHIVALREAGVDRNVHFLVMDHIDGQDLHDLVARAGPLPTAVALHYTLQAARGLAAAHASGVVHRDVKPANLMRDQEGTVRVLDLGLARVIAARGPIAAESDRGLTLTKSGALMGTVAYMAPEQALDARKVDHRADIYGLACTLHYLLNGRPPFVGDSPLHTLMAHQNRPAPSLRSSRRDVPESLDAVYLAMMAKAPSDRPRSMAEVVRALECCAAAVGLDAGREIVSPSPAPPPATVMSPPWSPASLLAQPPPRRLLALTAVWAALLALLVVLVAAGVIRPPGERPIAGPDAPPIASAPPTPPAPVAPPEPDPILAPVPPPVAGLSPPPALLEGYSWLFQGKDLAGWSPRHLTPADWALADGALHLLGRGVAEMGWFTGREYGEFALMLEYRPGPAADGGIVLDFGRPGLPSDFVEVRLDALADSSSATGDLRFRMAGTAGRVPRPPGELTIKPGDWNLVELRVSSDRLTMSLNGEEVPLGDLTLPGRPCRVGLCGHLGEVRFRAIMIRESSPATVAPEITTAPAPQRPAPSRPLTLFRDDFDDPNSGWATERVMMARQFGYQDGDYYINCLADVWYDSECPFLIAEEVTIETSAGIGGTRSKSRGAINLTLAPDPRRCVEVRVDIQNNVSIGEVDLRVPRTRALRRTTWFGPTRPPALRKAPEPNKIALHVRKRSIEVEINGVKLGDPIACDFDLLPARFSLGNECTTPGIRVQFDRIEIRRLEPPASPEPETLPETGADSDRLP